MATPLTGEVLLATRTTNTTATVTVTAPHTGYGNGGAMAADWNGARLRLRWQYEINVNEEAIRLDPSAPSIAVGNPLPTDPQAGGEGFWAGRRADGYYGLRVGGIEGLGPQLLYDGQTHTLALRDVDGYAKITLDADGNSYFAGPMTIGTSGGIWQGTGTFAAPTTGLKLYNSGGVGRLSTYNAGLEQITINTAGQLVAGQERLIIDRAGMSFHTPNESSFSPLSAIRHFNAQGEQYAIYQAFNADEGGGIPRLSSLSIALHETAQQAVAVSIEATTERLPSPSLYYLSHLHIKLKGQTYLTFSDSSANPANNGVGTNYPFSAASVNVGGGLALGDSNLTPPAPGRILMKNSSGATTVPAGCALLYLDDSAATGNKQELWVRFADGTYVKLAGAATA